MTTFSIPFSSTTFSITYLIFLLSTLAILFMLLISYWNKILPGTRPSLSGNGAIKGQFIPPASAAIFDEPARSSKVIPPLFNTYESKPYLNGHAQGLKKKPSQQTTDVTQQGTPVERSPSRLKEVWQAIKKPIGKFNILIVDDEPINLKVLENHLSSPQYVVTPAMNGLEALELIDHGQRFDLVILDVMMPHMSGYQVCEKLRESFPAHELPIVMLTAKYQVSDLVMGFEVGANDYLRKPFSKEELLSRIQTHLLLAKINNAYTRFVPHEFIELLGKESIVDVQLGDQVEKEVTLLFSDIRSFTRISEQMTPQDNFDFLNRYLERISPIIREHDGFINQYIGDAIMALFAGPAKDAIQAAIAMQHTVRDYNQHGGNSSYQSITIGIGLHRQRVMLGIIGENERLDTTVISNAMDVVMRLEELTKLYSASILITQQTLAVLDDPNQVNVRFLDKIKIKGQSEAINVFEVLDGDPKDVMELKLKTRSDFEEGLAYYQQKAFADAQASFERVLAVHPEDHAAWLYQERITRSIKRARRLHNKGRSTYRPIDS